MAASNRACGFPTSEAPASLPGPFISQAPSSFHPLEIRFPPQSSVPLSQAWFWCSQQPREERDRLVCCPCVVCEEGPQGCQASCSSEQEFSSPEGLGFCGHQKPCRE